jgi:hypothetical protein
MVYFKTKNPNMGKFWRALKWIILWTFGIFFGHWVYLHIVFPFGNVVVVWYIFPRFGILCQEKSGNPVLEIGKVENNYFLLRNQFSCNFPHFNLI